MREFDVMFQERARQGQESEIVKRTFGFRRLRIHPSTFVDKYLNTRYTSMYWN